MGREWEVENGWIEILKRRCSASYIHIIDRLGLNPEYEIVGLVSRRREGINGLHRKRPSVEANRNSTSSKHASVSESILKASKFHDVATSRL